MIDAELAALASATLETCRAKGLQIATAESCTGGLVIAALTAIAGSSDVVDRGFVTYSNDSKCEMLGVSRVIVARHGAVSEECARAMAYGALERSNAAIAVAITGIAGPGGGSAEKPVGRVHLACAATGIAAIHRRVLLLAADRNEIRSAAAVTALEMIIEQARAIQGTRANDPS